MTTNCNYHVEVSGTSMFENLAQSKDLNHFCNSNGKIVTHPYNLPSEFDFDVRGGNIYNCFESTEANVMQLKEWVLSKQMVSPNRRAGCKAISQKETQIRSIREAMNEQYYPVEITDGNIQPHYVADIGEELHGLGIRKRVTIESISQMKYASEPTWSAEEGFHEACRTSDCDYPCIGRTCLTPENFHGPKVGFEQLQKDVEEYHHSLNANIPWLHAESQDKMNACSQMKLNSIASFIAKDRKTGSKETDVFQLLKENLQGHSSRREKIMPLSEQFKEKTQSPDFAKCPMYEDNQIETAKLQKVHHEMQLKMENIVDENKSLKERLQKEEAINRQKTEDYLKMKCDRTSAEFSLKIAARDLKATEEELRRRKRKEQTHLKEIEQMNLTANIMGKEIALLDKEKERTLTKVKEQSDQLIEFNKQKEIISDLKLKIKKLKKAYRRSQIEKRNLIKEKETQDRRIENLQETVQNLQRKCGTLQQNCEDESRQQKTLEKAKQQLEENLCKATDHCKDVTAKLAATEDLKLRIQEDYVDLESKLNEVNNTVKELQNTNQELEGKEMHLNEENVSLRQQFEAIAKEMSETKECYKIIEEGNKNLGVEAFNLQQQLRESERKYSLMKTEIESMQELCGTLRNDNHGLQELNRDLEKKNAGLRKLCADFDDLMEKNQKRMKRIEEYKEKIKYFENSEKENIEHLAAMVREGKRLGEVISELEKENSELQKEIDDVRDSKSRSMNSLTEYESLREILRRIQAELGTSSHGIDSEGVINNIKEIFENKGMNFNGDTKHVYNFEEDKVQLITGKCILGCEVKQGKDEIEEKDISSKVYPEIKDSEKLITGKTASDTLIRKKQSRGYVEELMYNDEDTLEIDASIFDNEVVVNPGEAAIDRREEDTEGIVKTDERSMTKERLRSNNGPTGKIQRLLSHKLSAKKKMKSTLLAIVPLPNKPLHIGMQRTSPNRQHFWESDKPNGNRKQEQTTKKEDSNGGNGTENNSKKEDIKESSTVSCKNKKTESNLKEVENDDDVEYTNTDIDDLLTELLSMENI